MRVHDITGRDGVRLAVFDTGPVDAMPILLIHGWSQHHLSWSRQLSSPLADSHRLVVPDLRGHGASQKPEATDAYNRSTPWAGDLAAIIETLQLDRPVLVGWSMGGWVVQDYLRLHGSGRVSGAMLVGAAVTSGNRAPPEARAGRLADPAVMAEGMYSRDQAENLAATVQFVEACFATPPERHDLARIVGFNMLVPPRIRAACRDRSEDYRTVWSGIDRPVAILWGTKERVVLPVATQQACETLPKALTLPYANCGHSPFWEDAPRFNADLAAFAARCRGEVSA